VEFSSTSDPGTAAHNLASASASAASNDTDLIKLGVLDKLAGSAPVTPIYLQVCSWAFPTAANDHRAITLCHRPKVGSCAEIHRSAGGRKYVEFATPSSPVKLALYGRRALAKDAGVSPDGTGSHVARHRLRRSVRSCV
jgi:hypothetical protein